MQVHPPSRSPGPGRETTRATRADRVPGEYCQALARFLTTLDSGPSRGALSRILRERIRESGLRYHLRTIRRQLHGEVATVPRVVEDELVALAKELTGLVSEQELERRLEAVGLVAKRSTRRAPRVPSGRVTPLVRLWLHHHPDRSKRSLAQALATDLRRRGMPLAPGYLEVALGGKGRSVRREVLEQLLEYLGSQGIRSEADATRLARTLHAEIASSMAGREVMSTEKLQPLVRVWQQRDRGITIRRMAKLVQEELARRGHRASLAYLQSQLNQRRRSVRRDVLEAVEHLVRMALPDALPLAAETAKATSHPAIAADAAWVEAAPIAAMAEEWLEAHPEVSRRGLALQIAEKARRLGYHTSHNTIQVILAGKTRRTRGFVYRAMAKLLAPAARDGIPPEHVLDARLRRQLQAMRHRRAGEDHNRGAATGYGGADAMSMFLRELGQLPSMTREEEIEAARLIEAGELEILEAVLCTSAGRRELALLGKKLRSGELTLRDLIRDYNDKNLDPAGRRAELLALFDRLARQVDSNEDLATPSPPADRSSRGARIMAARPSPRGRVTSEAFHRVYLAWEPIRTIARRIKGMARTSEREASTRTGASQRHEGATRTGLGQGWRGAHNARLGGRQDGAPGDQARHGQGEPSREVLRAVHRAILQGERMAETGRARLVESHLWLVNLLARKHLGRGLPLLDLVQEGAIGLLRAAEKFDHRQGYRFATYATWWARSSIAQALAEQGNTIRIPATAAGTLRRIIAIRSHLTQEMGREPTSDEIAGRMELPEAQITSLMLVSTHTTSLHQPVGDQAGVVLEDFLEDDRTASPSELLAEADLTVTIRKALATLSPREQMVLRQRYGINGDDEHSLRALGDELGLSRERVRQIESRALDKLRRLGAVKSLEPYLRD